MKINQLTSQTRQQELPAVKAENLSQEHIAEQDIFLSGSGENAYVQRQKTFDLPFRMEDTLNGITGAKRVEALIDLVKQERNEAPQRSTPSKDWLGLPDFLLSTPRLARIEQEVQSFPTNNSEGQFTRDLATLITSSYPGNASGAKPICDKSRAKVFDQGNFAIVSTADGCNWGAASSMAAEVAVKTGEEKLLEELATCSSLRNGELSTQDIGHCMMAAAAACETAILANKTFRGTTAYLQTVISARADHSSLFDIISYSVGDMKAFLYHAKDQSISEITADNRGGSDATDPGGRLGRYPKVSDLRNAQLFYCEAKSGDLLIQVSDGVHDCLDPSKMGFSWQDSTRFADLAMQVLLQGVSGDPSAIARRLSTHALALTASSRELMEQDASVSEPKDCTNYPGKMDHVSVTVLRIAGH